MTENALSSLFRHKSYYLNLPSKGKYYKTPPALSADGELGIMPMTAADEIKLKSPDALFNGEAMYELFKSCVPDIPNPKEVPVIDVDAILIGIRMAAGEKSMSANSTCPECKTVSPYDVDLGTMLQSIKPKSFDNVIEIRDNVEVTLTPATLESQMKVQMESFYQLQMQRAIAQAENDITANKELFEKAFASAVALQIAQVADCIKKVEIKGENAAAVTDPDQIAEWVRNMTSTDHKTLTDRIQLLGDVALQDTVDFKCPECGHEYTNKVDLNPANFF